MPCEDTGIWEGKPRKFEATLAPKSPLRLAPKPFWLQNRCSRRLRSHFGSKIAVQAGSKAILAPKSLLKVAPKSLWLQNHCSSLLQSHLTFKNAIQKNGSKPLGSALLGSVLLCSVHVYARVHTSICIYQCSRSSPGPSRFFK